MRKMTTLLSYWSVIVMLMLSTVMTMTEVSLTAATNISGSNKKAEGNILWLGRPQGKGGGAHHLESGWSGVIMMK